MYSTAKALSLVKSEAITSSAARLTSALAVSSSPAKVSSRSRSKRSCIANLLLSIKLAARRVRAGWDSCQHLLARYYPLYAFSPRLAQLDHGFKQQGLTSLNPKSISFRIWILLGIA